jgi:hypothetical protein
VLGVARRCERAIALTRGQLEPDEGWRHGFPYGDNDFLMANFPGDPYGGNYVAMAILSKRMAEIIFIWRYCLVGNLVRRFFLAAFDRSRFGDFSALAQGEASHSRG